MSDTQIIGQYDRTLASGVAIFAERDLVFTREPNSAELNDLIRFLSRAHDCSLFWWGALLNKVRYQKRAEYLAQATPEWQCEQMERCRKAGKTFDLAREVYLYGEKFAREAANSSQYPDTMMEAMLVCESLGSSRFKLKWSHHREAVAECGKANGAESVKWLRLAEENEWTASEMRSAIRSAHASDTTRSMETVRTLTIATEMRRLTSRVQDVVSERPVSEWTLDEVIAFQQDAEAFLVVTRAVDRRFAQFNPSLL